MQLLKIIRHKLYVIFIFSLIILESMSLQASEVKGAKHDTAPIDPSLSSIEDIHSLFLKSAFSVHTRDRAIEHIQPLDIQKPLPDVLSPDYLKKNYPSLVPVLYPARLPKFFVLNKWASPVTFSIGFPEPTLRAENDNRTRLVRIFDHRSPSDKRRAAENIIINQVEKILPQLKDATHLDVSLVEKNTSADVQIIFVSLSDFDKWHGNFKPDQHAKMTSFYVGGIERYLDGVIYDSSLSAVFFTPRFKTQVYGYFFPDHNNHIQKSFCFVWDGHEEKILRALANECVLRSMGLPEGSIAKEASFSGQWFSPKGHLRLPDNNDLSPLDVALLKLLYDKGLKPGSDMLAVRDYLATK